MTNEEYREWAKVNINPSVYGKNAKIDCTKDYKTYNSQYVKDDDYFAYLFSEAVMYDSCIDGTAYVYDRGYEDGYVQAIKDMTAHAEQMFEDINE